MRFVYLLKHCKVVTSLFSVCGELTLVWSWDKPQAAVVHGGIFQGDPHPEYSAEGLRVEKGGILMRHYYESQKEHLLHKSFIFIFKLNKNIYVA